eukprot:3164712-Rhodomonas_salina.1
MLTYAGTGYAGMRYAGSPGTRLLRCTGSTATKVSWNWGLCQSGCYGTRVPLRVPTGGSRAGTATGTPGTYGRVSCPA